MAQEKLITQILGTITRRLASDVTVAHVPVVATTNEGEVKVADAQNQAIEGILLQTGKAGDLVEIVTDGIVPVKMTGAANRLDALLTSSNGMMFAPALTSGTTYNIGGRAFTKNTAALEYCSVQISPQKLRLK